MSDADFSEKHEKISNEFNCTGCGAVLQFKPGSHNLKCTYCGAENAIQQAPTEIEEIDYEKFINEQYAKEEKMSVSSVRCDACGASFTLDPNVTSDQCPYCASSIVLNSGSTSTILKPKSLVPFNVNKKQAAEKFKQWIDSLWFAPNDLKKADLAYDKISGIYVPYWTYDTRAESTYTGQRGEHYYETEYYTTQENGETVEKSRQVKKTHWYFTAGRVTNEFDDIPVIASNTLPKKYTENLEPWNFTQLVPFNEKYLGGFRSEAYQVELTDGLEQAKQKMAPHIRATVNRDIGGDAQRIFTLNSSYHDITFKHVLLPIWISSYRFNGKVYRFVINGQSGKVQGERPWSAVKIALLVMAIIAVIVAFIIIKN